MSMHPVDVVEGALVTMPGQGTFRVVYTYPASGRTQVVLRHTTRLSYQTRSIDEICAKWEKL